MFIVYLYMYYLFSRGLYWDPINRFNPATFLCLSKAKT